MAQVGSRIPEPVKGSNNPSRLQQMQAQFQRRLQEEKDGKMGTMSAPTSLLTPGPGSVRQFFAQRRAAAQSGSLAVTANNKNNNVAGPKHGSPVGWDKSYPLSPIKRSGSSSGSSSGYESVGATTNGKPPPGYPKDKKSPTTLKPPARRAPSLDRKAPAALPTNEIKRSSSQILTGSNSNTKENNANNNYSYQPRIMKASPPPNRRQPPKWSPSPPKASQSPTVVDYQPPAPRRPQNLFGDSMSMKPKPASLPASKVTTPVASYGTKSVAASPPAKPSLGLPFFKNKQKEESGGSAAKEKPKNTSPPDPNLAECPVCGRRFNKDRIAKHEEVCRKASTKKRKVFDPTKMRVQGTELEQFVMNNKRSAQKGKPQEQVQPKKSDWRAKRAGFIEALRQAKVVQKHLAAGGKVSDLPPPPPMDTSDYIQCPHCNRKFAAGAAERHIPKCKNIRSNKK